MPYAMNVTRYLMLYILNFSIMREQNVKETEYVEVVVRFDHVY